MSQNSSPKTMPAYVTAYRTKYGSLQNVCKAMPFEGIGMVAAGKTAALTEDVPSFVRLNETFGPKASMTWLYVHLKNLLLMFLVDDEKISDEQIDFLAETIINNQPTMKLKEFMLFESYFLGGRYEKFFGETSYILAITRSLQSFKSDLAEEYRKIEDANRDKPTPSTQRILDVYSRWDVLKRDFTKMLTDDDMQAINAIDIRPYTDSSSVLLLVTKEQHALLEEKHSVTFVALCRKYLPGIGIFYKIDNPQDAAKEKAVRPVKDDPAKVCRSAKAIIDNTIGLDDNALKEACNSFRKRYGMMPEAYLRAHKCYV